MTSQRKRRLSGKLAKFVQQYARKRGNHKGGGHDPNDRGYDRKIEEKMKRMDPEELDALLNGDVDVEPETEE